LWESELTSAIAEYSAPIPLRASRATISQFAETVAKKLDVKIGAPLEPLIARLGGKITYQTPNKDADNSRLPESIIVRSAQDFTIYLPTMTVLERDRFTIAHELGHLILHYPLAARASPGIWMRATRWVDETNADLVRTEWEANWFAAAFLMPATEFTAVYKKIGAVGLTSKFKVSEPAARIRAKSLGLVNS
jgi:Zn-dependent peptidase ImmA (M78 family)